MFELSEEQKNAIEYIEKIWNKQPVTVLTGYAGSGKAQPNNLAIPTPRGMKKIGELKIGDYVFDRFGKPTKIIGIFPQGKLDNYKVTLGNGKITYCNDEHLWTCFTSRGNFKTKTLKEIMDDYHKKDNRGHNVYKYKIPCLIEAVEFEENQELPIDPYVLGCFLGDGCCRQKYLTISSADEELVKNIAEICNFTYKKNSSKNYNWYFYDTNKKLVKTKEFFKECIKELVCYSYEKRIPEIYKFSSVEERKKIVQGLMDTDGSINKNDEKRFNCKFTSTSINLIKDFSFILESLGYETRISEDKRKEKYTTGSCYSMTINCANEKKVDLFNLTKKKEIAEKAIKYKKRRIYDKVSITNIEKMEKQEDMTCIMVDNPEHLYLTNNFIVTHNTTIINDVINKLNIPKNEVAYCAYTGCAAMVLKRKGIQAQTIHHLIYNTRKDRKTGKLYSILKYELDRDYKLIVIDEGSFVGKKIMEDLLTFKVPIIMMGDEGQLPPPIDKINKYMLKPDVRLTKIFRQKDGNSIIEFANNMRKGLFSFNYNDNFVKCLSNYNLSVCLWADQVLCCTNKNKTEINKAIREYKGFKSQIPEVGDKLMCLKNNWYNLPISGENYELVNGMTGYVEEIIDATFSPYYNTMKILFSLEFDRSIVYETTIDLNPFLDKEPIDIKGIDSFDFGYACTIHKAQGAQWEKVLVIGKNGFGDKKKLYYTAATRAIDKLVWVS